jgi:hypothetical protein
MTRAEYLACSDRLYASFAANPAATQSKAVMYQWSLPEGGARNVPDTASSECMASCGRSFGLLGEPDNISAIEIRFDLTLFHRRASKVLWGLRRRVLLHRRGRHHRVQFEILSRLSSHLGLGGGSNRRSRESARLTGQLQFETKLGGPALGIILSARFDDHVELLAGLVVFSVIVQTEIP